MQRNKWLFVWKASELEMLCEVNRAHHAARFEHYSDEMEKAKAALEKEGFEFKVVEHSGGGELWVDADNIAGKQFQFSTVKMKEHEERVREYERWFNILTANPDEDLALDHEDFMFFVGRAGQELAEQFSIGAASPEGA